MGGVGSVVCSIRITLITPIAIQFGLWIGS